MPRRQILEIAMESGAWAEAAAIVSIALALTIYYTAIAWFRHSERMAKIEQGIDPDQADPEKKT